jgi:hypothetical protein
LAEHATHALLGGEQATEAPLVQEASASWSGSSASLGSVSISCGPLVPTRFTSRDTDRISSGAAECHARPEDACHAATATRHFRCRTPCCGTRRDECLYVFKSGRKRAAAAGLAGRRQGDGPPVASETLTNSSGSRHRPARRSRRNKPRRATGAAFTL